MRKEGMSDLETVGYSLPKNLCIVPNGCRLGVSLMIRKLMNGTLYITDLGDGSRFHIYCQPFVELFFNIVKFGTVGDKFCLLHIRPPHEWRSGISDMRNQTM